MTDRETRINITSSWIEKFTYARDEFAADPLMGGEFHDVILSSYDSQLESLHKELEMLKTMTEEQYTAWTVSESTNGHY